MISVSDILKLLDQVPIWKKLSGLPARLDELERRVKDLEGALAARPARDACPRCGGALEIERDEPHPTFGMMGVRNRHLACSICGFRTVKELKPGEV